MGTTEYGGFTVAELEQFWAVPRSEWGLLGPAELPDDEPLRFVRVDDPRESWDSPERWTLERYDPETGSWYCAIDGMERGDVLVLRDLGSLAGE